LGTEPLEQPVTVTRQSAASPVVAREAVTRWVLGVVLVTTAVLVVVLLAGGGAPQPVPVGLPDAGPVTGWGLPLVRLAADLLGIATLGLLLVAALLLPSPAAGLADIPARATAWAGRAATGWLVVVAVEAGLTVSDLFGLPPGDVLEPTLLRSFLGQTAQGRGLLIQAALVVVVAGLARSTRTTRGAAVTMVVALAALAPPSLTGHSASAGSHELAAASLLVHLLAAGLWVGGLAALAWATLAGTDGLRYAVPRFSALAAWCFATVAASGVLNAGVRLGGLTPLYTSSYGALALAKVAALAVLGGFGWWHRQHTVAAQVSRSGTGSGRLEAARLFLTVAGAELVVMASTVALAVGLSRTPTPAGDAVRTSVAAALLGFPLPAKPTWSRVAFGWVPDGFALAFLVFAIALYAAGVLTLRRRGDRWPVGRTLCWASGLLVFAWATVGGLGLYSHVMFSAHMVAHMLLSMVAPIGLVLGAPVTLALRALPGARVPGEIGPRQLLIAVLHSRVARVVMHPLVAFAVFVGSLYGLYFTSLFGTLMSNHLGHVVMEFHFLTVGFLFFFVLVGIDPTPVRLPSIARIGLLFAAMPAHAFFSVAIMGGDTLLAPGYFHALDRPYSTDLLGDQHLGGGIGWALGELPVLLVLGAVFVQWARSDAREAARFDRAADRASRRAVAGAAPVADELSRYNAYLASLAERDSRHDVTGTTTRGPLDE
jgi:cytochrome c oxidase assembly factor CtaG/putative copper export protein